MRKRKVGRKFGKKRDQRRALLRSLAVALIFHQKIKTTLAKAKELRPFIEKLVTHARTGKLADRRHLLKYLPAKAADRLFKEIAPKFHERPGGYTRIIKTGKRKTDQAPLAIIEFVGSSKAKTPHKKSDVEHHAKPTTKQANKATSKK